jgi:hypothetical protein
VSNRQSSNPGSTYQPPHGSQPGGSAAQQGSHYTGYQHSGQQSGQQVPYAPYGTEHGSGSGAYHQQPSQPSASGGPYGTGYDPSQPGSGYGAAHQMTGQFDATLYSQNNQAGGYGALQHTPQASGYTDVNGCWVPTATPTAPYNSSGPGGEHGYGNGPAYGQSQHQQQQQPHHQHPQWPGQRFISESPLCRVRRGSCDGERAQYQWLNLRMHCVPR